MGALAAIRRIPGRAGVGDRIHTVLLYRAENRRDTRQCVQQRTTRVYRHPDVDDVRRNTADMENNRHNNHNNWPIY